MAAWRLYLVVWALSFIGFGAAFIFHPSEMAAIVTLTLNTVAARTDVRATYGGLEFGVGVFFLACAMRRDFVRIGLFCAACVLMAMGTARFVGLLLDGFWQPLELLVTVIELAGGLAATWGALVATPAAGTIAPPIPTSQPSHQETPSSRS